MKITIDIDCTPQEARTFLGMPDVEPLNAMLMEEVMERAKDRMDNLADPEKFVSEMMTMGGKSMETFQTLMAATMSGKK